MFKFNFIFFVKVVTVSIGFDDDDGGGGDDGWVFFTGWGIS